MDLPELGSYKDLHGGMNSHTPCMTRKRLDKYLEEMINLLNRSIKSCMKKGLFNFSVGSRAGENKTAYNNWHNIYFILICVAFLHNKIRTYNVLTVIYTHVSLTWHIFYHFKKGTILAGIAELTLIVLLKIKLWNIFDFRFLRSVRVSFKEEFLFITANVWAEMKKTVSYKVDLRVNNDGVLQQAQCECGAGQGPTAHCKHVCTVFYGMTRFCQTGDILTELTCTQVSFINDFVCKKLIFPSLIYTNQDILFIFMLWKKGNNAV